MKKEDPRKQREVLRREEIRRSILRAAETVIMRKGYSAMTMDDVAEEARLSKTTLYKYVRSKGRFIFEMVDFYLDEKEALFRSISDSGDSASEKLRRVIREVIRSGREKSNLNQMLMADKTVFKVMRLIFKGDEVSGSERLRKNVHLLRRKSMGIVKCMARIVEMGIAADEFKPVDPMETAVFISSFLDGVKHAPFLREEMARMTDEELSEKLFVFIYSSIRKPEDDSRKAMTRK